MQITLFRVVILVMITLVFASCQKHKKEMEALNAEKDSIQEIVDNRNDMILDYVISFNEIQQNLDSIKRVQKLMNVSLDENAIEIQKSQKDKILEDIALMNDMLSENKRIVAALQKKIRENNGRISELEQMIQSYIVQIEEKDAEIAELSQQIGQMQTAITQLNEKVVNLTEEGRQLAEESQKKSEVIQKQTEEINTAYYCFGSQKELISNNVIEKHGGFLGLGRTFKVKADFNQDYLTRIDIRNFPEVSLMVRKAHLLTLHPDSTYHFVMNEKKVDAFVIDDAEAFWKTSKYLVILVEP